ncbi:MAG: hypothetical protein ACQEW8_08070 [Actinomycetota bacterium]
MNRRIAVFDIAAVAALGLTACSGGSASPETETEGDTSASAPAEQPPADQSVQDACAVVQSEIQDAGSALSDLDVTAVTEDPQPTIDALTAIADGIGSALDSVSNEEVREAATTLQENFVNTTEAMTVVLVEGDMSAAGDFTTTAAEFQTSFQEFSTLCTG